MQLIIAVLVAASFATAAALQRASRYFPTNLLIGHLRYNDLRRLWVLPLLAAGYLGGAALLLCVGSERPSPLAVLALVFCWNGIKLLTATAVLALRRVVLAARHGHRPPIAG